MKNKLGPRQIFEPVEKGFVDIMLKNILELNVSAKMSVQLSPERYTLC